MLKKKVGMWAAEKLIGISKKIAEKGNERTSPPWLYEEEIPEEVEKWLLKKEARKKKM